MGDRKTKHLVIFAWSQPEAPSAPRIGGVEITVGPTESAQKVAEDRMSNQEWLVDNAFGGSHRGFEYDIGDFLVTDSTTTIVGLDQGGAPIPFLGFRGAST